MEVKNDKVHTFRVQDAIEYGVDCAVILSNIRFWLDKNMANGDNIYDQRVWTYNSAKAFAKLFPYWSEGQIYRRLNKLEEAGILLTGIYNKTKYDQTKWYSISEPRYSNSRFWKLGFPEEGIVFTESGKPIPYSKQYIKPYKNEEDRLDIMKVLQEALGNSMHIVEVGPKKLEAWNQYLRHLKQNDFSLEEPMKRMAIYAWQKISNKYPDHRSLKEAKIAEWYKPLRKLNNEKGIGKKKILEVFDWAIEHEFWEVIIRNTAKFEKNFEELEAQYKRDSGGTDQFYRGVASASYNKNNYR